MLNEKNFICNRKCGECCIKYFVMLSKKDIARIKRKYEEEFFVEKDIFLPKSSPYVLKKKENSWCVFLKKDKRRNFICTIYNIRPAVCREYPFFKKNIESCKPVTLFKTLDSPKNQ